MVWCIRPSVASVLLLGAVVSLTARSASAQLALDATTVTVDFTGFDGTGIAASPSAGQLSSLAWSIRGLSDGDVDFGGNGTTGDFARGASPGDVMTGGIYAFDHGGGNVALGIQPSGSDLVPGAITVRFKNELGHPLLSLDVSYTIWVFPDEPRSNSFGFSWSTDNVTYTRVSALDFSTPEAAPSTIEWTSYPKTTTLALDLPTNGDLYLRWNTDDVSGAGSRDEIALDDVTLEATAVCGDGKVAAGTEECDPVSGPDVDCCSVRCKFTDGNSCSLGTCNVGTCEADAPPAGGQGGQSSEEAGSAGEEAGGSPSGTGGSSDAGRPASGGGAGRRGSGGRTGAAGSVSTTAGTSSGGSDGGGSPGTGGANGGSSLGAQGGVAGAGASAGTAGRKSTSESKTDGGCGCRTPNKASEHGAPLVLALGLIGLALQRRRARAR